MFFSPSPLSPFHFGTSLGQKVGSAAQTYGLTTAAASLEKSGNKAAMLRIGDGGWVPNEGNREASHTALVYDCEEQRSCSLPSKSYY